MELKIDNASIEKLVQEHIKVAVAGILAKQSDYLVGRLVDHALTAKERSYDSTTILEDRIAQMIREEAQAGVKEWLDTKRADIRKRVWEAVSKKSDGIVAKIVEKMVLGLSRDLDVIAYLKSKD